MQNVAKNHKITSHRDIDEDHTDDSNSAQHIKRQKSLLLWGSGNWGVRVFHILSKYQYAQLVVSQLYYLIAFSNTSFATSTQLPSGTELYGFFASVQGSSIA